MRPTAQLEVRRSEDRLALDAQAGDESAIRELIRRLYPGVHAFVFRMLHHDEDARDVTQDVFLRMVAHLGDYRGEYKFTTWLFRIAINRARDVLRTRGRQTADLDAVPEIEGGLDGPESLIGAGEDRQRLLDGVRRLPESVRVPLLMAYQTGLPHAEIAGAMGLTTNAVKLRIHKALQLLRKRLVRK